jgi:hypothetical protein
MEGVEKRHSPLRVSQNPVVLSIYRDVIIVDNELSRRRPTEFTALNQWISYYYRNSCGIIDSLFF